jgi:hypothetical protein
MLGERFQLTLMFGQSHIGIIGGTSVDAGVINAKLQFSIVVEGMIAGVLPLHRSLRYIAAVYGQASLVFVPTPNLDSVAPTIDPASLVRPFHRLISKTLLGKDVVCHSCIYMYA